MIIGILLSAFFCLLCIGLFMYLKRREEAPGKEVQTRLSAYKKVPAGEKETEKTLLARVTEPMITAGQRRLMKITPVGWQLFFERKAQQAGSAYRWGKEGVILYCLTVTALWAVLMLTILYPREMPVMQKLAFFITGTVCGAYVPIWLLNRAIEKRKQDILRQLPDFLDLLCVSVQAGLGLDSALRRITEKMDGPLPEECRQLLHEIQLGMNRRQAMERMAMRCDIPELDMFLSALIQAGQMGMPLGSVLQIQAENMRHSRLQRAKKAAQEAPIKMLFPMALFIFPTILIVILLPVAANLMAGFSALGGK